MSNNIKKVLLVGAGNMAREYAKVLQAMDITFEVVTNGSENAQKMRHEFGAKVYEGGLKKAVEDGVVADYNYAINAVNAENLSSTSCLLLDSGINNCLIEKPGFTSRLEAEVLKQKSKGTNVYIAYNRRFYASVDRGKEIIESDGGITSFSFEFTEWSHIFDKRDNKENLKFLFLGNSTHVVDMAFYLAGGMPTDYKCFVSGKNEVEWHKKGSLFTGAGMMENGALFSYSANWRAPGRWGVEVNTRKHRLIYRPLEKLQLMDIGSVAVYDADVDYSFDEVYKPGLYKEVKSFLNDNNDKKLCTLDEQMGKISMYAMISGEEY